MGNTQYPPSFGTALSIIGDSLQYEEVDRARPRRYRKGPNKDEERGFALRKVDKLTNNQFSRMFRMSREGFENLLDLISPFMHDTDEELAIRAHGYSISKRTKLYTTLRWLSGGSYVDICFAWDVSSSAFYHSDYERGILWPTIEAIDAAFEIGLPLDNSDELTKLADEFTHYSGGELYGCVTAIDGWVARTRKPNRDEVDDIMAYRNRHGCWGVVVLAGCDARCRFTMFSAKNTGSCNDIQAWVLRSHSLSLTSAPCINS
jgi:hypothetical protein